MCDPWRILLQTGQAYLDRAGQIHIVGSEKDEASLQKSWGSAGGGISSTEFYEMLTSHRDSSAAKKKLAKMYRVIHKSLRDFRTRLRNNQDRHGRKEHINR